MTENIEGFGSIKTPSNQNEIDFEEKPKKSNKKSGGFQSFSFDNSIIRGIQKRGYNVPTPIQRKTIPIILQGRDVVAMARTGSGKTACFLLPMFEKLMKEPVKAVNGPRALILTPTRELAFQTLKFAKELGKFTGLKAIAVLGGDSMENQFTAIHAKPDIIIATPGRFLHLCVEMDLKLLSVEYMVFDEADRLFEMGFGEQLGEILARLPEHRQTLLFSATLPSFLVEFAKAGLNNPVLVRLDVESKIPSTLELSFFYVRPEDKSAALVCLLKSLPQKSQKIVFAATKYHVEYLNAVLECADISSTYLYSDLDATARKINAAKFKNRNCEVLIVTDIAARGVDIPELDYVINYHFPAKSKLFVHRVGRCARAGRVGTAYSLISADEGPYLIDLHVFLGRKLNLVPLNAKPNDVDKEGVFGRFPDDMIDSQKMEISNYHKNHFNMDIILKGCSGGYKRYLQSRPGATTDSVKKHKLIDYMKVGIHPFFGNVNQSEKNVLDLQNQMKYYKPSHTIFESIMKTEKTLSMMKSVKKVHQKKVESYKKKMAETENKKAEEVIKNVNESESESEDEDEDTKKAFSVKIPKKRKNKGEAELAEKKQKLKDEEYYIPYFTGDRHTEEQLAVNNFTAEANNASLNLTYDNEEGYVMSKRMQKWDQKRKRLVNVENSRVGKIRTEHGQWIPETFKTKRYEKWKARNNALLEDQNADESDEDESEKTSKTLVFPNTHWGRHNLKVAAKLKSKTKMKSSEQLLKVRRKKDIAKRMSVPREQKHWMKSNKKKTGNSNPSNDRKNKSKKKGKR